MKRILPLTLAALLLAAAPAQARGPNEAVGTMLGAAGGGLIGSQIGDGRGQAAATAAGVALGAILGNAIGRDADGGHRGYGPVRDRHWRHSPPPVYTPPAYGLGYAYGQPAPAYRSSCRQVVEDVLVNGWRQTIYRTACRQPDGSWRIVR